LEKQIASIFRVKKSEKKTKTALGRQQACFLLGLHFNTEDEDDMFL
jgi:hypothetical protein